MERLPIRVLRRVLPRYHGTGFGRLLFKASNTVARFIENDNYSFEENGELRIVQCLAKSGFNSPIFDVGANIGEYAVLARRYFPDSAIFAFEPVKETYLRLCRETEGLNIHAFNFGLGDQDADVLAFILKSNDFPAGRAEMKGSTTELSKIRFVAAKP